MTITLSVPLTRSGKIIASLMAEHGDNLSEEQIIRNLRAEIDSRTELNLIPWLSAAANEADKAASLAPDPVKAYHQGRADAFRAVIRHLQEQS